MGDRTYRHLIQLTTFEERFEYLALAGIVGDATFGFDRWMNQLFYAGSEWQHVRTEVIARDNGCDLGIEGREIHKGLYVHHMNPITPDAVANGEDWILDPEFLICTSHRTHNAIHYGDASLLQRTPVERRPGDTKLW